MAVANLKEHIWESFKSGFVSPLDYDSVKSPPDSLADILNLEINDAVHAVKLTPSPSVLYQVPQYSGVAVAIRKWGVDKPNTQEITAVIHQSNNLLRFSEDFEVSDAWSYGSLTIQQNNSISPQGTRKADRLSGLSGSSYIQQTISSGNPVLNLIKGKSVTFSVYGRAVNTSGVISLLVGVDVGEGYVYQLYDFAVDNTGWTRGSSQFDISPNAVSVVFKFGFAGDSSMLLWGAQAEIGGLTEYGYTFEVPKPMYLFIRPYYSGGSWVDAWLELTEKRSGRIQVVAGDQFAIQSIDGSNGYYNGWMVRVQKSSLTPVGNSDVVVSYSQSGQTFTKLSSNTYYDDDEVVICRSHGWGWNVSQAMFLDLDAKSFNFSEYRGSLRISSNSLPAINISYADSTTRFPGAAKTVTYDKITLDCWVHDAKEANYPSNFNLGISFTGEVFTDSGNLQDGDYDIAVVAVVDGNQKYLVKLDYGYGIGIKRVTVPLSSNARIVITPYVSSTGLSSRLTGLEIYVGKGAGADINRLYRQFTVSLFSGSWSVSSSAPNLMVPGWGYQFVLGLSYQYSENDVSLFQELGRNPQFDSDMVQFFVNHRFLRGKYYAAPISEPKDNDVVVFSRIRGIVEEVDVFQVIQSQLFGMISVGPGGADKITALAVTPEEDLLIFKDRKTYLFQVGTGTSTIKRLIMSFDNIGCVHQRAVADRTDYGTFWYDYNGIYRLASSGNVKRIGEGRILRYWQSLKDYIPYSFAVFNRLMNEYWIFTQFQGSVGSVSPTDYKVLRYSPVFDNWNLMSYGNFIPVSVTDRLDGSIEVLGGVYVYLHNLTNSSSFPTRMLSTHKSILGWAGRKRLEEVIAKTSCDSTVVVSVMIDSEATPRDKNSKTVQSGEFLTRRPLRVGSVCREASIHLEVNSLATNFSASYLGLAYSPMEKQYGGPTR